MKRGAWSFHPALESFNQFRGAWDNLNRRQDNHILLDSGFVAILLRHFGSSAVMLAIKDDPANPAMALIERRATGIWETFQPSWAPLGLILYGDGERGRENLRSLVRALPGYAVQLGVLQQDPDFSGVSEGDDCWIEKSDYMKTARIPLEGTFQEYWNSREDRLRKNNDRLRRRMIEKGLAPHFSLTRDPACVEAGVREFGRLESKSWKVSHGTAVGVDDAQARFYREVLGHFCERGEGEIYQLRVNDQVIATDIGVVRDEMAICLKTTYDEDWSVYAPGVLLREDIIRELYSSGRVRNYEFYGPLMDYQLRWTRNIRTLYHLTCFRHSWVRGARGVAKRFRDGASKADSAKVEAPAS